MNLGNREEDFMSKKLKKILVLLVLSTFQSIASSYAADDDNYNFSWLDPEKKIYVLQNRKYTKANHATLFALGGSGIGETYRTVYQAQGRIGYWFNEDFGFEAFYNQRFNSVNNSYKALIDFNSRQSVSGSPYTREILSQMGVLFNWAPWYAKINVFNSILFFDWYFSLGLGSMSTQIGPRVQSENPALWRSENLFAVFLGTGQLFHLSENWMMRLDFLAHFYSAEIYGGLPGAATDKSLFSNFAVNLGIGLKL